MNIGVLSDSHGRVAMVRKAVAVLDRAGAEAFIHCGDIGKLDVLDELAVKPAWFVWGNTDEPRPSWRAHVARLGLSWPEGPLDLSLAGKRVGVFHGHEAAFVDALRQSAFDYLLYGHTHHRENVREGSMRLVNPGALYRAPVHTVALIDLAVDRVDFLEVD